MNTVVMTKTGRVNRSETLRETAIFIRREKRTFHASEIVQALAEQGVTVTEKQVRSLLSYSGARYTGVARKRQYWELQKREEGMYEWVRYQFDPEAEPAKMITLVEEGAE